MLPNSAVYATVEQVKLYLNSTRDAGQNVLHDSRIADFCVKISRDFDARTKCVFAPVRSIESYDYCDVSNVYGSNHSYAANYLGYGNQGYSNSPLTRSRYLDRLKLEKPLLELVELKTNNGGTTIPLSDVVLKTGESNNLLPYDRILLKSSSTSSFAYTADQEQSQTVDGIWGYHNNFGLAWKLTDTVQDNPLPVGGTALAVTNSSGFLVQGLIRFGDDNLGEFAQITNNNIETNTLTIDRGINGTTAAQQALNTNIYSFQPMQDIVLAVIIWTAYEYQRKDNAGGLNDRPVLSDTGLILGAMTLPPEVKSALALYTKKETYGRLGR